jgi:hypothetical protein
MRNAVARAIAHPDPLVAASSFIALVLAWNAPLYPVYVWFIAGPSALPSALLTACSLPVFAAVPLLARRSTLAARVLLCLAGTANSVFCCWVIGAGAGVALFLLPCIQLATLAFRPAEWRAAYPLALLPILFGWALLGHLPAPPHQYTADQYQHLLRLNAGSVAVLIAFLGFTYGRAIAASAAIRS